MDDTAFFSMFTYFGSTETLESPWIQRNWIMFAPIFFSATIFFPTVLYLLIVLLLMLSITAFAIAMGIALHVTELRIVGEKTVFFYSGVFLGLVRSIFSLGLALFVDSS